MVDLRRNHKKERPRRHKWTLYKDILLAVYKRGGYAKYTPILAGSNMSWKRLNKHLAKLERFGYLKRDKKFFVLTKKGKLFIKEYWKFKEMFFDILNLEAEEDD